MSNRWTQNDIPDMTGKVVIITGANSGLGLESTKAIAAKGATVVMACRNMSKAEKAKAEVLAGQANAKLDVMALDNASLDSVRAFADAFKHRTRCKKWGFLWAKENAYVWSSSRANVQPLFE